MPLIVEEDVLRLKVTMDHTRGEGEDEKVEVMDRERREAERKRERNKKGFTPLLPPSPPPPHSLFA